MCDYQIRQNEDGDLLECDSCNYPAPLAEFDSHEKGKMLLCEVCSSTRIGSVYEYPAGHDDVVLSVLPAMGWIANKLLSEIRALKQ